MAMSLVALLGIGLVAAAAVLAIVLLVSRR